MSIKTLSSRVMYQNKWLTLREDEIERSNGERGIYGVVDKADCAVIIPIQDDHVYLVEQYRYTVQGRHLEFPQGGWETYDVDPLELARGELQEETGLIAGSMQHLGEAYVAYGYANQKQHIFQATDLQQGPPSPDAEEHDLVVKRVTIAEFERMLREGLIPDVCTLAAWALWKAQR
jgi:8-oxo-dGTP pyrophosphatase MutT (NUDIX family)